MWLVRSSPFWLVHKKWLVAPLALAVTGSVAGLPSGLVHGWGRSEASADCTRCNIRRRDLARRETDRIQLTVLYRKRGRKHLNYGAHATINLKSAQLTSLVGSTVRSDSWFMVLHLDSRAPSIPGNLHTPLVATSSLPHRDLVVISSRSRRTAWRFRGGPSLGDVGDRVLGSLGEVRVKVRIRARARARARVRVRVGATVRARVGLGLGLGLGSRRPWRRRPSL